MHATMRRTPCRPLIDVCCRRCAGLGDTPRTLSTAALVIGGSQATPGGACVAGSRAQGGHGGAGSTSAPATGCAAWLAALAAAASATAPTALADAPTSQLSSRQQAPAPDLGPILGCVPASPRVRSGAAASAAAAGAPAMTNHPLEYDPVTNEHTAKMTLARTAALDYYNAGKYTQAEAKFREAVLEAQLGFEARDPHIASTKNNLAEFLRNTGRWDEAEALYKEALELLELSYGERHWLFVSALHNLALSYEARGDLAAARATMERVLGLRLSMFGPRHFLYADSLFALGHMLRKGAQAEEAGTAGASLPGKSLSRRVAGCARWVWWGTP
ncbi:Kinesin light chain 4 [Tetrabaena socialis]|uniref:Kinesin light chain 4 n=1 Tax=Tetrabaena socialis TaxID=47790 RepID=A0A2J8A5N3_9CHLO|nr:Kinesin light chain 4 [Tetrabaena socialis]|eukprot:PNH07834.1 Kinesin light chain 4 [Tetrabaena socialis]